MKKPILLTLFLVVVATMWANMASAQSGTANGMEYVDLGLPSGTKWATCNLGATRPEDYGDYYAWGEIIPNKTEYTSETYKWYTNGKATKYNKSDGKTTLDPEDDAATAKIGADWHIPSMTEMQELVDNCTWRFVNSKGVLGYEVEGPNGNFIFLPSAGNYYETELVHTGDRGHYWTSSVSPSHIEYAYSLNFTTYSQSTGDPDRSYGFTIRPVYNKVTTYDLRIAGKQVTSDNCADLSVISGVSGTVNYDPDTKTLTLNNAEITGVLNGVFGIENKAINGLTIKLIGNNRIDCNDAAMLINANTTITGSGTLSVVSNYMNAISFYRESLTIENCDVNLKGAVGIGGGGVENQSLTIRNSNVTVESTNGCIDIINSLTLDGCYIKEPADAYFSTERHGVVYANGSVVIQKLVISKETPVTTYDLRIAGLKVTSANCADLSVIDGVSGTVNYDPDTKTLTLNNAEITGVLNEEYGIENEAINGLTIKLIGNNRIDCNDVAMIFNGNTAITGSGTLSVVSNYMDAIDFNKIQLFFDGCDMNITGAKKGIAGGSNWKMQSLIVRASNLAIWSTDGCVTGIKSLTLNDCAITQPTGAYFQETSHRVVDADGKILTQKLFISKNGSTGITSPEADAVSASKLGVYNLQGVCLGISIDNLPKGIYIVDGKKVVKK